jgi:Major Facilitator Superfamily
MSSKDHLPCSYRSPVSPSPSITRSLSQHLNRSLSAIRLRPLSYYTLPELEISNLSIDLPTHFDHDYVDLESDASECSDWDEDREGVVTEDQPTDIGTIPEGDGTEENFTPPPPLRHASSRLQWRTVPPRKPVPLSRSKTTLNGSQTHLSRHKSIRRLTSTEDPNLVTWKGDDDPLNPLNWSKRKKWLSTILVSSFTFISPIASTMVAPALEDIADEFGISTSIEKVLIMSIFLLAYAVGPFVIGPLSEVFGRVVVLQSANMVFLLFNFVCGFAKTKEQMMAFRFLSGLGGSAPQAVWQSPFPTNVRH